MYIKATGKELNELLGVNDFEDNTEYELIQNGTESIVKEVEKKLMQVN